MGARSLHGLQSKHHDCSESLVLNMAYSTVTSPLLGVDPRKNIYF